MKYSLSEVRKTLVSLIPLIVLGAQALSDALGDGVVTNQEWVGIVIAALTPVGVFAVSNKPGKGSHRKPDVSEAAA